MHLFVQLAIESIKSQINDGKADPSIPVRASLLDEGALRVVNMETGLHVICEDSEWGILTAVLHLFRRSLPASTRTRHFLQAAENPPAALLECYGDHVPLRAFQYCLWKTVVVTPNYSPCLWVCVKGAEHKLYVQCQEYVYGDFPLTTAINSWEDPKIAQELIKLYQAGVHAIQSVHLEKPMPEGWEYLPRRGLK